MRKIFKYKLETKGIQEIEMPQGAEILCIQNQFETPCIWAIVEPNATVTKRTFVIIGTGQSATEHPNNKYIGTYQLMGGQLVFHCFEI
jgi:hypothetical protein